MNSRKRSGSTSKRPFQKEKVVFYYEQILWNKDSIETNSQFWEEFFLLQPNTDTLESEISKLNLDNLIGVKDNIRLLFSECINMLNSDNTKRIINSLQTLCVLVLTIFKKTAATLDCDFQIINILMNSETNMKKLIISCNYLLTSNFADAPKSLCLKLMLALVTGTDIINKNVLLEYVMINNLFESIILLLSDPISRVEMGHDAVILLTLIVNYRKNEGPNPYVFQLSLLADEQALNGYGYVISNSLIEFCHQYSLPLTDMQTISWFSSLSNIVGNMFVSDEGQSQQIRANNALLLALYEAVHLNRNFITTLAHTQTDTSSPPSPSNTLNSGMNPSMSISTPQFIDSTKYPTNLFVAVFQYCSIVMQDHKSESSIINLKLAFILLICISEDTFANSMMHDSNLTFKVFLHRAHMRHRKLSDRSFMPQPLTNTLLDLLVEFMVTHMMKKFPMELYLYAIGIIHRLLCYQKRCRVRLSYPWKELWTSLIGLLKFVVCQEPTLIKKYNIFNLALQIVNIFNFFITYGDTFLATTNSYDELYYELNREEKVFSELHAMVLRYTSMYDCEYKEDVIKLLNALVNILAITKHFQIKIKEWLAIECISTPTESQILDIVRKNYDLTLKLQDSLDHYDRYSESPVHQYFFNDIVKEVIQDTRKHLWNSIKNPLFQTSDSVLT
ncbi:armadillo-like helical domain-containing protein 3 [Culicoides brevitarsis]|uniref:armadillo-like helical domain-containing protein 3 n=1 Tax=Culicoides brevitarsis TaxID=469753 RepID=UPI00307CB632